jgi:hypothetical protein
MIIESNQNPSEILQPCKQSLDLPAPFVTPHFSAVLRLRLFPIRFVRRVSAGLRLRFVQIASIPQTTQDTESVSACSNTRSMALCS